MNFNHVKDSGAWREFSTGSVRDRAKGKGRFDLLPPHALRRIAIHYENGARKYDDRNWEKGQPLSVYLDSAIRHLVGVLEGMVDEDHLAAAAWNVMGLMETQYRISKGVLPQILDDLPQPYKGVSENGL